MHELTACSLHSIIGLQTWLSCASRATDRKSSSSAVQSAAVSNFRRDSEQGGLNER